MSWVFVTDYYNHYDDRYCHDHHHNHHLRHHEFDYRNDHCCYYTCARNLEQLIDGTILVIFAILVSRGGARLPSNLGHLAPLARRVVYILETKIARLLPLACPHLLAN